MRELTRKEQLEWLKDALERELDGVLYQLEACVMELIGVEDMDDSDKEIIFNLATRLNQIRVEQQKLDIEHNKIIHQLWDILPNLKGDENLQLKLIKDEKGGCEDND